MAEIKAFNALRFTDKAGNIGLSVCPPYDIISDEQREEFIKKSEYNIIRLEKPMGENAYEDAKKILCEWIDNGILKEDGKKAIYIYEEEFEVFGIVKKFRGIFVLSRLYDFSEKVVLPHEETLSKAKADRFNLMNATYCNFSPIYSMYHDENKKTYSLIEKASEKKPDIEFTAADGVIQRLWIVTDEKALSNIENAFTDKQLFIADGHHRYETALNFRNKLREEKLADSDSHKSNYVMMFLVDMENEGLVVFPTHRLIRDLKDFDCGRILNGLKNNFNVVEISDADIEKKLSENKNENAYCFYTKDKAYLLTVKDKRSLNSFMSNAHPNNSDAYRKLDVSVLHTVILEELFGIDRENMAKQINLTYTRDISEAKERVRSGECLCSFILNPTKVSEIRDVALANDKMPQKSTYFYPKLITGLVMNRIAPIK